MAIKWALCYLISSKYEATIVYLNDWCDYVFALVCKWYCNKKSGEIG